MTYELYRMGKDLRWGGNKRRVTCAAKKFFLVGSSGQDVNFEKRNLFRLSRNQHLKCHICYFIKIFPWLCGSVIKQGIEYVLSRGWRQYWNPRANKWQRTHELYIMRSSVVVNTPWLIPLRCMRWQNISSVWRKLKIHTTFLLEILKKKNRSTLKTLSADTRKVLNWIVKCVERHGLLLGESPVAHSCKLVVNFWYIFHMSKGFLGQV